MLKDISAASTTGCWSWPSEGRQANFGSWPVKPRWGEPLAPSGQDGQRVRIIIYISWKDEEVCVSTAKQPPYCFGEEYQEWNDAARELPQRPTSTRWWPAGALPSINVHSEAQRQPPPPPLYQVKPKTYRGKRGGQRQRQSEQRYQIQRTQEAKDTQQEEERRQQLAAEDAPRERQDARAPQRQLHVKKQWKPKHLQQEKTRGSKEAFTQTLTKQCQETQTQ